MIIHRSIGVGFRDVARPGPRPARPRRISPSGLAILGRPPSDFPQALPSAGPTLYSSYSGQIARMLPESPQATRLIV